jgi:hypothetical protein
MRLVPVVSKCKPVFLGFLVVVVPLVQAVKIFYRERGGGKPHRLVLIPVTFRLLQVIMV